MPRDQTGRCFTSHDKMFIFRKLVEAMRSNAFHCKADKEGFDTKSYYYYNRDENNNGSLKG